MAEKLFSQNEVNRIITSRIRRERDRLTKEFENKLKRCMAAVHLTLYQEMCLLKREMADETKDTLLSDLKDLSTQRPANPDSTIPDEPAGR